MNKNILLGLYAYLFLMLIIFQYSGRDSLIENFYTEVAIQKQDTRICDLLRSLPTYYSYERCDVFVARAIPDPSICATLSPDGEYRDMCHRDIASRMQDVTFCDELSLPENKAYCYGDVAVQKNDPTLCNVLSEDHRPLCLEEYRMGIGES